MKTLTFVIKDIMRYKDFSDIELISLAHGPVKFKGFNGENIEVTQLNNTYTFDCMGRLFETGVCLLYPPKEYRDWNEYRKSCVESYYNNLQEGDICLVKKAETDNWTLAVYCGKSMQKFLAKQGKESETFEYCIPYKKNEGILGRVSFPDWMIDEENS